MNLRRMAAATAVAALGLVGLSACTDSEVASRNLSQDAEMFKIERRIVFYNGITDKYIAEVTGRCSVDDSVDLANTLAVTCKVGEDQYIKNYLGKADNVTWFALQEKPADVSVFNYKVTFKPEVIIPDVDLVTSN